MIGALVGLGLSRAGAWAVAIIGPVLLLVGVVLALDAWGDSRYRAGEDASDAAWKAASDKLVAEAATAANAAERAAAAQQAAFAARQEKEKERIDAAISNGASPVDVLFPVDNGVRP